MKRTRNLKSKTKRGYASRGQAQDAMQDFYDRNYGGVVSPNASVYGNNGQWFWGHSRDRKR